MGNKKDKKEETTPEEEVETPLKIAEDRFQKLIKMREELEYEGVSRMSGLEIKIRQAEDEVNRLKNSQVGQGQA